MNTLEKYHDIILNKYYFQFINVDLYLILKIHLSKLFVEYDINRNYFPKPFYKTLIINIDSNNFNDDWFDPIGEPISHTSQLANIIIELNKKYKNPF